LYWRYFKRVSGEPGLIFSDPKWVVLSIHLNIAEFTADPWKQARNDQCGAKCPDLAKVV
jgi:hypothetical protein